jgi:riboflavin transporter FmnP
MQRTVEVSMLSAMVGLLYLLTSTIGIDNYFSSVLPLPVLIAAMRRGAGAGLWVVVTSASLLVGMHPCHHQILDL